MHNRSHQIAVIGEANMTSRKTKSAESIGPSKLYAWPKMSRWSDAKLDKELTFARTAKDDNDPATLAWLAACEAEVSRRDVADELAGLQALAGRI